MHRHGELPYMPIYPSDENVISGIMPPTDYSERESLFNRRDIKIDLNAIENQIIKKDPTLTVEEFQYWAEGNWKTKPGTFSSSERFSEKLKEEFHEAVEAFELLADDPGNEKLKSDLASELGDILWCMSAIASNGGASIDMGLRIYLHKYALGMQIVKEGKAFPPNWHPKAAGISTQWEKITVQDLESLIGDGFEPTPSPVMNIYSEDIGEAEYDVERHIKSMLGGQLLSAAQTLVQAQYGKSHAPNEAKDTIIMQGYFDACAVRLSEIYAATVTEIAYIASTQLKMSLSEIMQENALKLSNRVSKGQVDKQDAPRTNS
jgi:NTP pyrophosphatase (non-canonical NTP hydrolase)